MYFHTSILTVGDQLPLFHIDQALIYFRVMSRALCLIAVLASWSLPPVAIATTTASTDCFQPFQYVGNRCVFVDPFVEGTWPEMRYRCTQFGSVLLEVNEPNFFLSVVRFIKESGLESTSYWIGGRKDADGDIYYWDGSRTNVTMGTPFWAIYKGPNGYSYEQEPDASGVEQCVLLNKNRRMFFSDVDCDDTVAGVICQRDPGPLNSPADQATQCYPDSFACDYTTCVSRSEVCDGVKNCRNNADEGFCPGVRSTKNSSMVCGDTQFECDNGNCVWDDWICDGDNDCGDFSDERNCDATSTNTTQTSTSTTFSVTTSTEVVSTTDGTVTGDCSPYPLYQSVGGKCISVEPFVDSSWEQMRYRCESFGGTLLEVEDPNLFRAVVEYIIENGIDQRDYWIGGRKDANDDIFYWDGSGTNVTMGTPFWAIYEPSSSGPYEQEPYTAVEELCVFMNSDRKLFFSATLCDARPSGVICQRNHEQS